MFSIEKAKRRNNISRGSVEIPEWLFIDPGEWKEEDSEMRSLQEPLVPGWLQVPARGTKKNYPSGDVVTSSVPVTASAPLTSAYTGMVSFTPNEFNLDIAPQNRFPLETIMEESGRSNATTSIGDSFRSEIPLQSDMREIGRYVSHLLRAGLDEQEARDLICEAQSVVKDLARVETPVQYGRVALFRVPTVWESDVVVKVCVVNASTQEVVNEISFGAVDEPKAVINLELGSTYRVVSGTDSEMEFGCDERCCDRGSRQVLFTPTEQSPMTFVLVKPQVSWKATLSFFRGCQLGVGCKYMRNKEVTEARFLQAILNIPQGAIRLGRYRNTRLVAGVAALRARTTPGGLSKAARLETRAHID